MHAKSLAVVHESGTPGLREEEVRGHDFAWRLGEAAKDLKFFPG